MVFTTEERKKEEELSNILPPSASVFFTCSHYLKFLFLFAGARRPDGLRAVDVMGVLREQLAVLSGGRDRRGGPVITFQASPRRERAKPEDYKTLLQYLFGVPR